MIYLEEDLERMDRKQLLEICKEISDKFNYELVPRYARKELLIDTILEIQELEGAGGSNEQQEFS